MNKDEYFSIFELIKKEHRENKSTGDTINNKILLVDFLNTFIRSFSGSPAMNNNGEHVGGISGTLYSIGNAIKTFGITRCILVADGQNSALRKRKIYPDYKNKRKVKYNLNRQYQFKSDNEEEMAMAFQLDRVLDYIRCMPIQLIVIDNSEADDVISYIANEVFCKDENKVIIMSSDKDFIQLITDRINIWSPTKKKLYTPETVFAEYGIPPKNFLLYRTLDGDKSDNLPGINGVGLKTIKKYLPILCEDNNVSISDLINYTEEKLKDKKKIKFYENIYNGQETLLLNESLMRLDISNLSGTAKLKIIELINAQMPQLNKPQLQVMYMHDGLSNAMPDFNVWISQTLTKLNLYAGK